MGISDKWKQLWDGVTHNEDVTEEEIISMVNEGHEQGVLLASEAEMIHNIFEFGDKEAKDIMSHRQNMIGLEAEKSFIDTVGIMIETGRSRYPVYEEDFDHIIGVLHIKDAFRFTQRNEIFRTPIKEIDGLLRAVDFVPETMKINKLFTRMQSKKNHMVVVIDEYGQTSGIVAMEDILEEIVGDIEDEHDEEEINIAKLREGLYRMEGVTPFEEVKKLLSLPLEEDAFETLNGFLVSLLDKIPGENEHPNIHAYGYTFQIVSMDGQCIGPVKVRKDPVKDKADALAQDRKEC